MELVVIGVLTVLCAGLLLRVYTVERALRKASSQLQKREIDGSSVRITMAAPNAAAEALLSELNRLLELRQADEAEYRAREQDLRRQIANVSHDLRTPLTSILGYLQLLEGNTLGEEERREYLRIVESRARALQSLITSFYDLSRLESGEYPLIQERVDLNALASELLAAFYNDLEEAGFAVTVDLQENVPLVWADAAGVLRVFTNLLRNVLEHGQEKLCVRIFQKEDKVLSVFENSSRELSQEDVAHVFERSFTSDRNRTRQNAGLGLAIVKALSEQMGGIATAALQDGVFSVTIRWRIAK